jgi:hypothetical protein
VEACNLEKVGKFYSARWLEASMDAIQQSEAPSDQRTTTRKSSCSQCAAMPAVHVACGCQIDSEPCCGISGLPHVATDCHAGSRVQIPEARDQTLPGLFVPQGEDRLTDAKDDS